MCREKTWKKGKCTVKNRMSGSLMFHLRKSQWGEKAKKSQTGAGPGDQRVGFGV